ncbi:MAG: sugar phosphate isomerase/epimerase [Planctomycetota bacterium]
MSRPLTLFTGQWADLPLETMCRKAKAFGYDGLELACWGDHFEVQRALAEDDYCERLWDTLGAHELVCFAVSNHLVGQAVCDLIDERHRSILPPAVWGDGDPEGVRRRAGVEMMDTARAARRFFDAAPAEIKALQAEVGLRVNGFTGSSIWHMAYSFPPVTREMLAAGFRDFAERWTPIMDVFEEVDLNFGLEVHPTEIAFDIASLHRALEAIGWHPRFGVNFDPSHFGYQGVDYLGFLREFHQRIFHVHVKDVWWDERPGRAGVFGGHTDFGADGRYWDFRSPGRGNIDFEGIIRILNHIGYRGPLSVEWEDPMMDREHGATEAADFVRDLDFPPSDRAFDAAFSD